MFFINIIKIDLEQKNQIYWVNRTILLHLEAQHYRNCSIFGNCCPSDTLTSHPDLSSIIHIIGVVKEILLHCVVLVQKWA